MKPESNRPIAIEDLLRLKRAERPPAEFWTEFDRKLRAKQLAALVEKRPWWQSLPEVFSAVYRYRIALGTSAICALTFLSIRQYSPSVPRSPAPEPHPAAVVAESANHVEPTLIREMAPAGGLPSIVASAAVAVAPVADVPAAEPAPSNAPAGISEIVAAGGVGAAESDSETAFSGTRGLSENFLASSSADLMLPRGLLVGASGFEARAMPPRTPIEPLQQMTPPSESRRSRILTAMVSKSSLEASSQTTERAASRMISDERTFDQIHRFGARGDRVQVKF